VISVDSRNFSHPRVFHGPRRRNLETALELKKIKVRKHETAIIKYITANAN